MTEGTTTEHRRCPDCGGADSLHANADCKWDLVAKAWIIVEWGGGVECTACDWSGTMEETEFDESKLTQGEAQSPIAP